MTTGDSTRLLTGTALTTDDLNEVSFPMAIIGGYRAADVEVFRTRAVRAVGQLHAALDERAEVERDLVAEIERLNGLLQERPAAVPPPRARAAGGQHALGVLAVAQQNADQVVAEANTQAVQIVGQARHQGGQLVEHAELQAAEILQKATEQAEAERTRIINDASAEARRVASAFRLLYEEMGAHLHEAAGQLAEKAAEWDRRAGEAQAEPPRPARQNGTRHQAAGAG